VGALVSAEGEKQVLDALVRGGAHDGITGRADSTVDGISWEAHARKLHALLALARAAPTTNGAPSLPVDRVWEEPASG